MKIDRILLKTTPLTEPDGIRQANCTLREMKRTVQDRWQQDHQSYNFEETRITKNRILENEGWLKQYWDTHPDDSLAEAISTQERLRTGSKQTPEEEAESLLVNAFCEGYDVIRGYMIGYGQRIPWNLYLAVRRPEFIEAVFRIAFKENPAVFSQVFASTVDELKQLDNEAEIESLHIVQEVMLNILRDGLKSEDNKGEVRRRAKDAIQYLEQSLDVRSHGAKDSFDNLGPSKLWPNLRIAVSRNNDFVEITENGSLLGVFSPKTLGLTPDSLNLLKTLIGANGDFSLLCKKMTLKQKKHI